jgi:translation initiation factor 4E|eukprot:TRINITY_DN48857_c0_g1_i1.p1 TRINITY_DN48857_c0_g1~~TRINITY_DN48857_c0_g1_i1.p1  ORF type:complete len:238 (-),score=44.46 TRINITY_DN48857_c0_g1_i1:246-959(-)
MSGQQPFLSFNDSINRGFYNVDTDDEQTMEALQEPMPLKDTWVLWEQAASDGRSSNYSEATRQVASFSTAQDFVAVWRGIPQPSELLEQRRIIRRDNPSGASVGIDAVMIFKEGITPEWEHPTNESGGHFQMQLKPTVGGGQIDEYWNNTVFGMIGGTIEPSDMITGIRLVDKLASAGAKATANALRIELWFTRFSETNSVNTLKRNMERCMATRLDGTSGVAPKSDVKPHSSIGKH